MNKSLKAPQVNRWLRHLGQIPYHQYDHAVLYDEHSYQLLDELFELLKAVKPYETRREDIVWKLWLRAERGTIDDFGSYEEMRDLGEVEDRKAFAELWKSECPNEVEWYAFQALYVKDIRCKAIMLGHRLVIVLDPRKETGGFEHDISDFVQWLVYATKEVIAELKTGVYNDQLERELPVWHRTGTILRKYEWEVWPHVKEEIMGSLSETDLAEFLACAEEDPSDKSRFMKQLTANDFFRFCALGYAANNYDGCDRPPMEQYKLHADGRDEGLCEIDPDSPKAFAAWYHDRPRGGHPWEVCRGGNSTHISLYVREETDGWSLTVAGSAWTRSQEAMKFFLALYRAGLPVRMRDAALLKERIMGEEKIGVVPWGVMPAYCHSYFPDEEVNDFMNLPYDEEDRRRIAEHCVWQPLDRVELSVEDSDHLDTAATQN